MDNSRSSVAEDACASCATLRRGADLLQQELHDARRSYHTALDVQRHLAAELEAAVADHKAKIEADRVEIAAVREQLTEARADRDALTLRLEAAHEELSRLSRPPPPRQVSPPPRSPSPPPAVTPEPVPEPASQQATLEAEARCAAAVAAAEKAQERARDLEEKLAAVEAAAGVAREAAEEREAEWVQSTALLRAQLHAQSPNDADPQHAEKGNSLFAEVDDKRQEMAQALLLMKQKNSQLRRSLAEARAELESARQHTADESAHHLQQLLESYAERVSVLESRLESARRAAARGNAVCNAVPSCDASARELATALQLWELRREIAAAGLHAQPT